MKRIYERSVNPENTMNLNFHLLRSQHSMSGHPRPASETPLDRATIIPLAKAPFYGVSLEVRRCHFTDVYWIVCVCTRIEGSDETAY